MSVNPQQFATPGYGIDYRIGNDDSGFPTTGAARGWRRPSIPVAEDGSIPSVSLLAAYEVYPNALVTDEQVDVSFRNPIYPSTYDIPNNEME
jgi:hypothetical protein